MESWRRLWRGWNWRNQEIQNQGSICCWSRLG
jgi:hypothetical protein